MLKIKTSFFVNKTKIKTLELYMELVYFKVYATSLII